MSVKLQRPIYRGPVRITDVEVRMPLRSVDLTRPPRGVSDVAWFLSNVTDLTIADADELDLDDAEAILEAYDSLLVSVRASARAIISARGRR